jgi:hypothetical protein
MDWGIYYTPQCPHRLWDPFSLLCNGSGGFSSGVKLTIQLHLVLRSRRVQHGLPSMYVFMAWCLSNEGVRNFTFALHSLSTITDNIVTCGLKAGTCLSAGRSFAKHVLMLTKYSVTMGFDGAFGDIFIVTTFWTDCYHEYEKQNSVHC